MSDKDELVSQFTDVTGVDADRARFYLELGGWQLEVALASYYENDGEVGASGVDDIQPFEDNIASSGVDSSADPSPNANQTSPGKQKSKTNSKFATIASLNKDTSSDEEEGQAFFAGGSEHSGQQVLGPGKKKNNIVAEMFKTAQEHGADVIDVHESGSSKRLTSFGGTGYKLGQSSNDSEVVGPSGSHRASLKQSEYIVTLKMWRDGFSINDGPLRKYSDPENKEFLETVATGEIPEELIQEARGSEVHVNMEDHSHDEFVEVKPKLKPFSGKGNVLGSPAPNTVSIPTSTTSEEDKSANETKAKGELNIDTSQPTTTIQIRLADGSRLQGTFNHSHTVADVRSYIIAARPEYISRNFSLLTTFPSKELSDGSLTLLSGGLLNAAILQRLS